MLQQLLFKLSNGHLARVADSASLDRDLWNGDDSHGDGDSRGLRICFVLPPTERYYSRSGGDLDGDASTDPFFDRPRPLGRRDHA